MPSSTNTRRLILLAALVGVIVIGAAAVQGNLVANTDVLSQGPDYPDEDNQYANSTKDTNDDGLSDSKEVHVHETDPTDPDTDSDELTDEKEVIRYQTAPNVADTDKDGVDDGAEIENGTNPTHPPDKPTETQAAST